MGLMRANVWPPASVLHSLLACARVDVEEMDGIAEEPGKKPPRKGEGTTRQTTEQTEGFYRRASKSGDLPETEVRPESRPQHVRDRGAIRGGDAALRTGEQPPPGVGSKASAGRDQRRAPGSRMPPKISNA